MRLIGRKVTVSLCSSLHCTQTLPAPYSAKAQASTRIRSAPVKLPRAVHHGRAGLSQSTHIARKSGHCTGEVRHQSRNVDCNRRDSGVFAKVTKMACTGLRKCCLVGVRHLSVFGGRYDVSSLYALTTSWKSRQKKIFQTPTTLNTPLFRINNITGMCRLGTKPECSLESAKPLHTNARARPSRPRYPDGPFPAWPSGLRRRYTEKLKCEIAERTHYVF